MLQKLNPEINAAILDMDGVLWRSDNPLCDLNLLFSKFNDSGIRITFATNNATKTVQEYVEKFKRLGVTVDDHQIVTAAMATADLLKSVYPFGGPIFVMGSPTLKQELLSNGFHNSDQNPLAVVVGMDRELTYEILNKTANLVRSGLPFYGTNPDVTYPTPEGLAPGAGACIAAIETSSGVSAIMAGKPSPYLFTTAMQRMKSKPSETLVIGDRLETDILGGATAGCKTALVLSGVSSMADLKNWDPKPDLVLDNIMDLFS